MVRLPAEFDKLKRERITFFSKEADRKLGEMARKYKKYRQACDTIESGPMRKNEHDIERIIGLALGIPAVIGIIGILFGFFLVSELRIF